MYKKIFLLFSLVFLLTGCGAEERILTCEKINERLSLETKTVYYFAPDEEIPYEYIVTETTTYGNVDEAQTAYENILEAIPEKYLSIKVEEEKIITIEKITLSEAEKEDFKNYDDILNDYSKQDGNCTLEKKKVK